MPSTSDGSGPWTLGSAGADLAGSTPRSGTSSANHSAIGNLVERTSRYTVLLHLRDGHGAEHVRDALVDAISDPPPGVRCSLRWDHGFELACHDEFTLATDVPVYFCERASP